MAKKKTTPKKTPSRRRSLNKDKSAGQEMSKEQAKYWGQLQDLYVDLFHAQQTSRPNLMSDAQKRLNEFRNDHVLKPKGGA